MVTPQSLLHNQLQTRWQPFLFNELKILNEHFLHLKVVTGQEKEGELATMCTSLEFQYLSPKSRYKMLIGRDDLSNDVITLGTCFHLFF